MSLYEHEYAFLALNAIYFNSMACYSNNVFEIDFNGRVVIL